ncbi:MAG: lipoyl(octanoyl) transferase [Oscillatoriales cyanobacterium]|nr:MAG: lipoyl(octanoyl) transferase [Oscillatoriales cyanobacterium]
MGLLGICWLLDCGLVDYELGWSLQKRWVAERVADPGLNDGLIVLEHPPVYTLGRGADRQFLGFDPEHHPIETVRVERGGEVTYHCPGQVVGYPILNLRRHRPDLHWYLRQLEEVLIQAIAQWGVTAERIDGLTGVWIEGYKVAAIGIKVSRWISMHGFALNVDCELAGFQDIVPCGIRDRPVGRLIDFVPGLTRAEAQAVVLRTFAEVFAVELVPCPRTALPDWSIAGQRSSVTEG